MKAKKIIVLLTIVCMLLSLVACGEEQTDANVDNTSVETDNKEEVSSIDTDVKLNEDYFTWDNNNYITGLTEEGKKQKTLIIPKRCEGFGNMGFSNTEIEHIIFDGSQDVDISIVFSFMESLVTIQLPSELTHIGVTCFEGCSSLKTISIPASVTTIEDYAFARCDSLETVVFEGDNIDKIASNMFKDCPSLKEIELPDSIVSIGKYAFENCEALETIKIPTNVKTIEEEAFFNCSSLSNVILPEGIDVIESNAFGNTAIEELHLPENINLTNMDVIAFGMNTYDMTVYIVKDSWCDKNQDIWNAEGMFGEIKYE